MSKPKLDKQLLLKISKDSDEALEDLTAEYIKSTEKYISKNEFIRTMLDGLCEINTLSKISEKVIICNPNLFVNRIGEDLFVKFMKGFRYCDKLQTNAHLYVINTKFNFNKISTSRNSINLFFDIVGNIWEFKISALDPIHNLLMTNKNKYVKSSSSEEFKNILKFKKEIEQQKYYNIIRNELSCHAGNDSSYSESLNNSFKKDEKKFIFANCLSDGETVSSNNVVYTSTDLVIKSLNMSQEEFEKLCNHTLLIMKDCIDSFQVLFHHVYTETLADNLISREQE